MNWLQSFFTTPARQALGWTVLGILGIAMAAGGVWALTDEGGSGGALVAEADDSTATATSGAGATQTRTVTPTASATASPTASPTPSETPPPAATTRPAVNSGTGGGGPASGGPASGGESLGQEPAASPVPEESAPPVVAGGDYCPPSDASTSPPNSVIGIFTIGGSPAPAGTSVSLAFDGVLGPTRLTGAAGGYRVDYAAAQASCANRVGAAISVVYNGVYYPTGHTVGDSPGVPVNVELAIP